MQLTCHLRDGPKPHVFPAVCAAISSEPDVTQQGTGVTLQLAKVHLSHESISATGDHTKWRNMRCVLSRLHAGWLLGWSLVKTLARRVFLRHRGGLALFRSNFAEDRLVPLSADERRRLPEFGRCIACGRCNTGVGGYATFSTRGSYGMMSFVLSSSRSIPDFDAAARMVSHLDDASLVVLEKGCPVGLSFRELVRFVRAKASEMTRS